MKFIRQYLGMRKELYILFWGRVVKYGSAYLAYDDADIKK